MILTAIAPAEVGPLLPLTPGRALTDWQLDVTVIAPLVVATGLYLWGMRRVARRHPSRPWPALRGGSWLAGLAVIAVATLSSIGVYDDTLFWIHMIQHLLLIMVAPALLVAGRPAILALHANSNPVHTVLKRALRSKAVTALTFPPLVVAAYAATIVGTHLTGFMNVVLTNTAAHDGEHLLYLVVGYLYFLLIFGDEPIRWRLSHPTKLFMIVLSMPIDTFTGVVLIQTGHPLFHAYLDQHRNWGPPPLTDLHWGGAVMWIGGDAIMLVLILLAFRHWWSAGTRHAGSGLGWLERARLTTLDQRVGPSAGTAHTAGSSTARRVDPDNDDDQLAAYNAWLARINGTDL